MKLVPESIALVVIVLLTACGDGTPSGNTGRASPQEDKATLPPSPILQAASAKIVEEVLNGKWGQKKDGHTSMKIEFYSTGIFSYTVKDDKSVCYFHYAGKKREAYRLNRAFDLNCDGTFEAVEPFSAKDYAVRPQTKYERAFLEYYLPRYAELFKAANGFKTWLPEGRLRLLPDLAAIKRNIGFLQEIVDATSGTRLGKIPKDDKNFDEDRIFWKIWVNAGPEDGGYVLYFDAHVARDGSLSDCAISLDDTTGEEVFFDKDCDAQPEGLKNNKGTKRLSTVGNEDVTGSALLEIARFARVANKYFVTPDEGDLPSP